MSHTHRNLIVGDDYPWLARNVRAGLDGAALESATATYVLLDDADAPVTTGNLVDYADPVYAKSFIGNVPNSVTEDLGVGREYRLRTTVVNAGRKTSRTLRLTAAAEEFEE